MEHNVYFWLKEEHQNATDRAAFEQGLSDLLKLPGSISGMWGVPAAVPQRPVVDLSWDYSLRLNFATIADHDAYQVHPDHNVFISTHSAKWQRVLVLDTETKNS